VILEAYLHGYYDICEAINMINTFSYIFRNNIVVMQDMAAKLVIMHVGFTVVHISQVINIKEIVNKRIE
jgi:hypothetical protein